MTAGAATINQSGSITFGGTINGAFALTANATGATTFGGAVGGAAALASLTTDLGGTTAINGGAITTTGAQTYSDAVTLGANTTLTGTTGTLTGGAAGGGSDLTLNFSGLTSIAGAVWTGIRNLITGGGGTTSLGTAITTTANQTYNEPVTLAGNTNLTSTAGNVTFAGSLNADLAASNRTLTVNASTGTVTFSGNVGDTQPLANLNVTAGPNTIVFNGAAAQTINVTAQGGNTVTFTGPTLLLQNLTLNTNGATANNVTFVDSINAGGVGTRTFTLNAGTGAVNVGFIGNTTPLGTLNVTGNSVTFNAGATAAQVAITANQVLGDPANGVIFATAPFAGFGGPAALTLSGLTTEGTFGTLGTALRVDVPGLLIVAPNASSNSSIVYLRGDPAKKPFYEFYDVATRRLVCYNGCPFVAGANPARPYDDFRLPEDPPDELGTLPPIAGSAGPAVTCVAVRTSETATDLVCDSRSR